MPDLRAVVWDLDGVIVDSGAAHNASWVAMAREFGVPYSAETDFLRMFGKHNTDIITMLWNVTDPSEIARMADSKEQHFRRDAHSLTALPGVLDLMRSLKAAGWRQAIGSSAPRENIDLLLQAASVEPFIDAIASGDDVTRGKPDPQVFNIAFERVGISPDSGVVIEDAPAGVQAGVAAGASVVGVTNTQTASSLSEAGAHLVVSSLIEVNVERLESLVLARTDSL